MTGAAAICEFVAQSRADTSGVTWNDASRVSLTRRYLGVVVPKVACSTLKLAIHTLEDPAHPIEWWETHADWPGWTLLDQPDDVVMQALTSPDWFRFCFVRNPYDRLVSAWKSKLASDSDAGYQWLRDAIREAFDHPMVGGERVGAIDFAQAFAFLTTGDQVAVRDFHWRPQVTVLHPEVIGYDVIGRFETFAEDFDVIFTRLGAPPDVLAMAEVRYNASFEAPTHQFYDAALAKRVFDFYEADFTAFGYRADSWRERLA